MNMVIGGKTPIFRAEELGRWGYGIVLYANAALQGAVMGMQKALTALRDDKQVLESSGLVASFAERQRLVGKPQWDELERRYTERAIKVDNSLPRGVAGRAANNTI